MKPPTKLFATVLLVLIFFAVLFFAAPSVTAVLQGWVSKIPSATIAIATQVKPTPSAASSRPLPTHAAGCLTDSAWQQAIRQKPAPPAELGGKIILSSPDPKSGELALSISNFDGSNNQMLKGASDATFSPDGAKVAYTLSRGVIYIMDLATGQSTQLPGTQQFDFNPHWSPDGSQIVFMRSSPSHDLFIVNIDGSGLRPLTKGGRQEWPMGWVPDGKLFYSVAAEEAISYLLDIKTGESQLLPVKNIAALSPDGKHVITQEKVFGDRWALYFSELDGSNRWQFADPELWASPSTFSPDGQWLLLRVSDVDYLSEITTLVHLDDCQIIPLPNIKGDVNAWTLPTP